MIRVLSLAALALPLVAQAPTYPVQEKATFSRTDQGWEPGFGNPRPYVRVGSARPLDGFSLFLGNARAIPSLEAGLTLRPAATVSYNLHLGMLRGKGDAIEAYGGVRHQVKALQVGFDARYRTALPSLYLFGGFTLSRFDGQRTQGGVAPNPAAPGFPEYAISLPAEDLDERKPKGGYRFGLEWAVTPQLGVVLDYTASEWYHRRKGGSKPAPSPYALNGINPVTPSWIRLSVQVRFPFSERAQ